MESEKIPVFGVYLGKRDSSGHQYYFFESLDRNDGSTLSEREERVSVFKVKLGQTSIGYIYQFYRVEDKISFSKKPSIVDYWRNSEDRLRWASQSRAYQDSVKKLKPDKEKTLKEVVAPLAQLYKESDYSTRAYILGEVIRLITTGR